MMTDEEKELVTTIKFNKFQMERMDKREIGMHRKEYLEMHEENRKLIRRLSELRN